MSAVMITCLAYCKSFLLQLVDNPGSITHFVEHAASDKLDGCWLWMLSTKDAQHIELLRGNSLFPENLSMKGSEPTVRVKDIYRKLVPLIAEFPLCNLFF
jgi:hypothetical protein